MKVKINTKDDMPLIAAALGILLISIIFTIWVVSALANGLAVFAGSHQEAPQPSIGFMIDEAKSILESRGLLQ